MSTTPCLLVPSSTAVPAPAAQRRPSSAPSTPASAPKPSSPSTLSSRICIPTSPRGIASRAGTRTSRTRAISWDASQAPAQLMQRDGRKVMSLFNLAFHHFDDPLARDILKDTVETSHGVAIFELQDRSFSSVVDVLALGIGAWLMAPFYAWKWRSPATLIFSWLIPILPLVIVFDGFVSSLRTRTPEDVESLLRGCGADTSSWEMQSGSTRFIWPCAYLNWIICKPVDVA